ncbi:hypothetical protein PAXRUDRAFT_150950 [Paxillus rubicundulus Ve08.2h10]|uniref:C2H2-type domain-containing protein n=1 Tax=Paxillus rubicundulus Ve08.2h10 TaxID=930991 RepID=A0A0D0D311_9AGAM|nr:hypothetical protein PAXRUDRAFT_150950 [Paxillus rubicundulus Ve08.2h10]
MPQNIPQTQLVQCGFNIHRIPCPHASCSCLFKMLAGLKHHRSSAHLFFLNHTISTGAIKPDPPVTLAGHICDENGIYIDPNTPPPPISDKSPDDWTPYQNKTEFEAAELIFKEAQLSAGKTDKLLHIWDSTLAIHGNRPQFADHQDLYNTIDVTPVSDIPCDKLMPRYNGELPVGCVPH